MLKKKRKIVWKYLLKSAEIVRKKKLKSAQKKLKSAEIVQNSSVGFVTQRSVFILKSNINMIFATHFTNNKTCRSYLNSKSTGEKKSQNIDDHNFILKYYSLK